MDCLKKLVQLHRVIRRLLPIKIRKSLPISPQLLSIGRWIAGIANKYWISADRAELCYQKYGGFFKGIRTGTEI